MGPHEEHWDRWELDLRDERPLDWGDVSPGIAGLISVWSWSVGILLTAFALAIVGTIIY